MPRDPTSDVDLMSSDGMDLVNCEFDNTLD